MLISRRRFLKMAGASVVVLGAGATGFVLTRTPQAALQPWQSAGEQLSDPRLQALSYAILAPNPHNRQPWLVKLVGEQAFDLHCDLNRRLPETDPSDRQITIGLGCFLELFRIAAARGGYQAQIKPFPLGEPQPRLDERPIARVTLTQAAVKNDPLFEQILVRRSTKEPFDTSRPLELSTMQRIVSESGLGARAAFSLDEARVKRLRNLTFRAFEVEFNTPKALMESVRLMRIGKAEINANPDGIDIGGTMPDLLHSAGLMTRETLADPRSAAFAQTIQMYRDIMLSGMGYLWLTTSGNGRRQQLQTGADWLRFHLAASKAGVSVHPVSQALQEYPEMAKLFTQVHRELGIKAPARLQMLARVGYGPEVSPSPRWPLQTRIM